MNKTFTKRFAFAVLSPVRLSVCLSSVTLVYPTLAVAIFGNISNGIWYLGHPLTSAKNFTEIIPREPIRRGSYTQQG